MTVPNIEQVLQASGIRAPQLDYLTTIIDKMIALQADVDQTTEKAQVLKNRPRCCGSEYIDPNGFLYANHGLNDDCPLHGQHPTRPGSKRLKKYIGNKTEAMKEVYDAMSNWQQWHKAEREVNEAKSQLERLVDKLAFAKQIQKGSSQWHLY